MTGPPKTNFENINWLFTITKRALKNVGYLFRNLGTLDFCANISECDLTREPSFLHFLGHPQSDLFVPDLDFCLANSSQS